MLLRPRCSDVILVVVLGTLQRQRQRGHSNMKVTAVRGLQRWLACATRAALLTDIIVLLAAACAYEKH